MASWNTDLAKRDFSLGHLSGFRIERAVLATGWNIRLFDGLNSGFLTTARDDNQPRCFKTLDAAVSFLEDVGFSVVSLSCPK